MSPRISAIDPASAVGEASDLLKAVHTKVGRVPNLMRTMAHSPAALAGYLALNDALGGGKLTPRQREQVALAVGQSNECTYCVSAHTAIGNMVGLSASDVEAARRGSASDPKAQAILRLTSQIVERRGDVDDETIRHAREAGVDDGELAEVVAHVALNVLTNYFNRFARTEVDFPVVSLASASRA